jgi:micrococcal nuclease
MDVSLKLFVLIISTVSVAISAQAEPTMLTGTVIHVRDGDTIEVGKVPIRLNGVSAPELKEPLGKASKKFMRDLVLGKPVRCELNGKKTYDRLVGTCYLGDIDIGVTIIKAGLALDCPRYSGGRYKAVETVAGRDRIKLPKYCKS